MTCDEPGGCSRRPAMPRPIARGTLYTLHTYDIVGHLIYLHPFGAEMAYKCDCIIREGRADRPR